MVRMSHDPVESAAAHATLVGAFAAAHAAGERVVVHCRGGQSRTGLALGAWLQAQHGVSAEAAAAEVMRAAGEQKLIRFAKAAKITSFTGKA
jgi:protein-tyrosine phosphatase